MPHIKVINEHTNTTVDVVLGDDVFDTIASYEDFCRWYAATSDPILTPTRKAYNRLTLRERQTIRMVVQRWDDCIFLSEAKAEK
jgi:hypothetical protein